MKKAAHDLELLLVEDNPADIYLIKQMLQSSSLSIGTIYETDRVEEANKLIETQKIHLILLDLSLPDSFGLNSFFRIKQTTKKIPVIILTGFADTNTALEAIKEGAHDYLVKSEINENLLARSIMYSLERQQQDKKLKESEEKYRQIVETAQEGIWMIDENNKTNFANKKIADILEYAQEEMMGKQVFDFMDKEEKEIAAKDLEQQKDELKKSREFKFLTKSGKQVWVYLSTNPIFSVDGKYKGALAMVTDITERRRLEQELAEEQKQKRLQITAAVLEAQEKERIAIGEELHDNINQILGAVKMHIGMALKTPAKSNEFLLKGMEYTSMAIEENRKLAKELILPQLKGVGLSEALKELADEIRLASHLNIRLEVKNFDETIFNEQQKISLYRIVQEQMNNVIKHAHAKSVSLQLYNEKGTIVLLIADDGKGFDPAIRNKGVGLTNIRSRAEVLNGKLEINSAPGEGCSLRIIIEIKSIA